MIVMDDYGSIEDELIEIAEEEPDAPEKGNAASSKLLKRLSVKYRPSKQNYLQQMTQVVQDPVLAEFSSSSSSSSSSSLGLQVEIDPLHFAFSRTMITYVAWHYIPFCSQYWRKQAPPGSKNSNGYPPCPHCYGSPAGERGGVTANTYSNAPQRSIRLGSPEYYVPMQYDCVNCPAGKISTKDNKLHSYFLATDPRLLEIMEQQGLSCATRMVQMSKEDKLGMDPHLLRLVTRGVVKEGSIKGYMDAINEINMDAHLTNEQAYYSYIAALKSLGVEPTTIKGEPQQQQQQQQQPGKQQPSKVKPQIAGQAKLQDVLARQLLQQQQQQQPQQQGSLVNNEPTMPAAVGVGAAAGAGASASAAVAAAAPAVGGVIGVKSSAQQRRLPALGVAARPGPYPLRSALPNGVCSQTYLSRRIAVHWAGQRQHARSLIHSGEAETVSMDFQFYPVKMVHTAGGRAAAAILNITDTRTGKILEHRWTQSVKTEEVLSVLEGYVAAGKAPFKAAYVDDCRLFCGLLKLLPLLMLIQDGFHFIDRFSRAIPADNSLKAAFIGELTSIIYQEVQADVEAVQAKLRAKGESLESKKKAWRRAGIRRVVRAGDILQSEIAVLFTKYESQVCPITGESPITQELKQVWLSSCERNIPCAGGGLKSAVELLQDRFPLSDLYTKKGVDADGLDLWACHRGTSAEEGMHAQINKLFKGGHYGPQLAQVMVEHWVFRWNIMCLQKDPVLAKKRNNYGTFNLQLLESVKAAAVAAGYDDPYPEWEPVQLLESFPPFGLETPTMPALDDEAAGTLLFEEADEDAMDSPRPSHRLEDMPFSPDIGLQPGMLMYCTKCGDKQPVLLSEDRTQCICTGCKTVVWDVQVENQRVGPRAAGTQHRGTADGAAAAEPPGDAAAAAATAAAAADDDMEIDSSAAAAAAGGLHGSTAAGMKRKVGDSRSSTARKVRLLQGKATKVPAARFSVLHFAAPVQTLQEEQLFWELYSLYSRGGTTQWGLMLAVWNFRANANMARHDFAITLKHERHLKEYHRRMTQRMVVVANAAAEQAASAAGLPGLGTRLGLHAASDASTLLPSQALFASPAKSSGHVGPAAVAAAAAAPGSSSSAAAWQLFNLTAGLGAAKRAIQTLSPSKLVGGFLQRGSGAQQQQQQQQATAGAAAGGAGGGAAPSHLGLQQKQNQRGSAVSQQQQQQQQQQQLQQHHPVGGADAHAGSQQRQQQQQLAQEQLAPAAAAAAAASSAAAVSVSGGQADQQLTHQQQPQQVIQKGYACGECKRQGKLGVLARADAAEHHPQCWRSGGKAHTIQKGKKAGEAAKSYRGKAK